MLDNFVSKIEIFKAEFDENNEEDKAEFIKALNDFMDGLGDAFLTDPAEGDFECATLDI